MCFLYRSIFLMAFITGSFELLADTTTLSKKQPQFIVENWKQSDGLPSNTIRYISQTPDGYLWLTTPAGLVRYDGYEFYILNEEDVISENFGPIETDLNGNLWIGTYGNGLVHYENGYFKYYMTDNILANDVLTVEIDNDNKVWATTKGGLYNIKDGKLQQVVLPNADKLGQPISISKDGAGNMWIYLSSGLLYNLITGETVDTGFKFYKIANRQWQSWDFIFDNKDQWWLATPEGVLYPTENGKTKLVTTNNGLTSNAIRNIKRGSDGTIWLGLGEGLFRLRNDGQINMAVTIDGADNVRVGGIYEDRDGSIWFGSYTDGLWRIDKSPFVLYSREDGINSNQVWTVVEGPDRKVWVGTEDGLFVINEDHSVSTIYELENIPIRSLCIDKYDRLWIGTDRQGIYIYVKGKIKHLDQPFFDHIDHDFIKMIYEDPLLSNVIWIGTQSDLVKLKDEKIETILNIGFVSAALKDKLGNLWCTSETGLYRFGEKDTLHYSSEPGLSSNRLVDLFEDPTDGSLWIGSGGGGLIHFKDNKFTAYMRKDGLNTNDVWGIANDASGNLWLSCDEGLRSLSIAEIEDYDKGELELLPVVNFGKKTNRSVIEFNSLGFPLTSMSREGAIWFPSMSGAVKVNPFYQSKITDPKLYIQRMMGDMGSYDLDSVISVNKTDRDIEFKYAAVYFGNYQSINYEYMLEGYDREWNKAGKRSSAFYTNLPPGRFKFRVRLDDSWGHQEKHITLVIQPHFYETAWFYFIVIVSIFSLVYYIFTVRTRSIRLRNNQLSQLNRQITEAFKELEDKNTEMVRFNYTVSHDLKSPLITIQSFLGILEEDLEIGDHEAVKQDIMRIGKAASNMNVLLNEILELSKVGLVVNELQNSSMTEIVNDALGNLEGKINNVEIIVHPDLPNAMCDKRRIMEVIQNLVENALKFRFQEKHRIEIGYRHENETNVFYVKDNGIGIEEEFLKKVFQIFERLDQEIEGTGIGLALVKRIIETHGGKVWVESEGKGKGCTFCFSLTEDLDSVNNKKP